MSWTSSFAAQAANSLLDALEDLLVAADQVHLVDRHDEVRDAQQRGDEGVAARLLEDALAGVDEHDRPGRRSRRR